MVVVGRTPSTPTDKGTTTVKKDYQRNNAAAATAVGATMPEAVTIALAEIAGSPREGPAGPGRRLGTRLQVMDALIDESVTAMAGPNPSLLCHPRRRESGPRPAMRPAGVGRRR